MNLVGEELLNKICFYRDSWLPARSLVEVAIIKRSEVSSAGALLLADLHNILMSKPSCFSDNAL